MTGRNWACNKDTTCLQDGNQSVSRCGNFAEVAVSPKFERANFWKAVLTVELSNLAKVATNAYFELAILQV